MKVFFYRVVANITGEDTWTTDVIDLYDNDIYRNFSVVKSTYGFAPTSLTWIGTKPAGTEDLFTLAELENPADGQTDSGLIDAGRFIDTSGRIDIISWNILSDNANDVKITVYHSDDPNDDPPPVGPFLEREEIAAIDANRYAWFEFSREDGLPSELEVCIRIEIDAPVMAPLYRYSRQVSDQFPGWMALSDTPEEGQLALPESVGGSFLNAIAGEWLDDIRRELTYRDFQQYIGTADLDQMAWAYKTSTNVPEFIWSIEGDGIELARTSGWKDFKQATDEDACFIDFNGRTIYSVKEYDTFTINGEEFYQEPHLVWNYLDELGLFVDLERLPLEDNETYKYRILDVYKNRGGVGVDALKKALRRELNLWKHMANIDPEEYSEFDGAYPEILEIEDLEKESKYFDPDGMPTEEFVKLVEDLSREYPTTWGRFVWGSAIWDIAGEDYAGYDIIPYRYDAEPLPDQYIQAGVGDGEDLYVFRPDVVTGARDFEATLKARGRERTWRSEYPKVEFDCFIYGRADREYYNNPTINVWMTIEIELVNGDEYVHSFEMSSQSDVDHDQPEPTSDSYDVFDFMEDGPQTSPDTEFIGKWGEGPYDDTGVIPFEDINTITLIHGRWDTGSFNYVNQETSNTFEAWFSHMPNDLVTYNSGNASYGWEQDVNEEEFLQEASVMLKSLVVASPVVDDWFTDSFEFHIELNGVDPYLAPVPVVVDIPEMIWDPHITEGTESLEIQLETTNGFTDPEITDPEYGATTVDIEGNTVFIGSYLLNVDGDNSWTSDGRYVLSSDTESIELSTGEDPGIYPIEFPVWDPFEQAATSSFSGVVDENGPWRNGIPSRPGNTNYRLEVVEGLTRDDFGIPNTDDYIVTWMGVTNDDSSRVITWLNNNTVRPAHIDDEDDKYPETSIVESIDVDGSYYYDPVPVNARLRPIGPEWNPQIHSGYFYTPEAEYYFYAKRETETTISNEHVLSNVVRQGAPIIVHYKDGENNPITLRRVSFFDEDDSPVSLSLTSIQKVKGSGENVLYLPHRDVYDVVVTRLVGPPGQISEEVVAADTETETNVLSTTEPTDKSVEYTVTYKLRNSFYADNDHIENGDPRTKLVFDKPPDNEYTIDYETSIYDPAREVDLPLNPFYSVHTEGFIFISHNEYTLDSIRVRLSPTKILADGNDYIMVTINSMDRYGNPKPDQEFSLSTTFGTLDKANIVTDHDGFAVIILTSSTEYTTDMGTLTVSGAVEAEVDFEVEEPNEPKPTLYAIPNSEMIQADGTNQNVVYGKIEGPEFQPMEGVTVNWAKARSMYELFTGGEVDSGSVTTNGDGSFVVGPFTVTESEDSGYWFISMEATVSGSTIGDVVFWYEYPMAILGVENPDGLPQRAVQMEEPPGVKPPYSEGAMHPTKYNEQEADPAPQPVTIHWLPPEWFAIDAERQYQLGINTHEVYNSM